MTVEKQDQPRKFGGKGLAPGVGCGVAYRVGSTQPRFYRLRISETEVGAELARFQEAVHVARQQYLRDKQKLEEVLGTDHSYIIEAHLLMLDDRDLIGQVESRIRDGLDTAENAVRHVGEELLSAYESLDDEFFKDRGFDFQEVIDRILANLLKLVSEGESEPSEDVILVGSEIGLSTLARFPLGRVQGLVSARSGMNSHLAIIARSLQIPLVTGLNDLRVKFRTGDFLCVDGTLGTVEIGSSREFLQATKIQILESREPSAPPCDGKPCLTLDGQRVHLLANTEFGDEVEPALKIGAEGIGLFRTEFLFMSHSPGDSEEEKQYQWYQRLAQTIAPLYADVRTLDVARRRDSRFGAGEEAGVLGLRGIRYSLSERDRFRQQVRAIARARQFGKLRIVLPMVSSVDELIEARALIEEAEREVEMRPGSPVPIGALIETPAAVWILDSLAPLCDFFAVGTNDLIQYTLAAGRLNDEVADLYNPMHPAILKSLLRIQQVAARFGKDVTVCGEMAANPLHAAVLIGLGYRKLSMTSYAIPRVREVIRTTSSAVLEELCRDLMVQRSLAEVTAFVVSRLLPEVGKGLTESRSH